MAARTRAPRAVRPAPAAPEAEEAEAEAGAGTSSERGDLDGFSPDPFDTLPDPDEPDPYDEAADAREQARQRAIADSRAAAAAEAGPPPLAAAPAAPAPASRSLTRRDEPSAGSGDSKAKAGPPSVGEWQDFFSRMLIKTATNFYIEAAFKDIDEDLLSDAEIERIQMTKDERDTIARPFAELANKLKITRRHGRLVISFGGVLESVVALGIWARRVNRIAGKYKQREPRVRVNHVGPGPGVPPQQAAANGHAPAYFSAGG